MQRTRLPPMTANCKRHRKRCVARRRGGPTRGRLVRSRFVGRRVWAAMEKTPTAMQGVVAWRSRGRCRATRIREGRLVACVGTTNVVVVETADAVLVVDRSHVQDVKGLVSRIKAQNAPEADAHRKVHRPWGFYDSIDSNT